MDGCMIVKFKFKIHSLLSVGFPIQIRFLAAFKLKTVLLPCFYIHGLPIYKLLNNSMIYSVASVE